MGSPISPFITNMFMEEFKVKAICSTPNHCLWFRYVDDTFVIQQAEHSNQFPQHINSQDPHIQFTMKTPRKMVPYLSWIPLFPWHLTTSVYRKPTHMDQYLHWDSSHNLLVKYSIYNTLAHRARVVYTSQPALKQEEDHIRKALLSCSSPMGPKQSPHQIQA